MKRLIILVEVFFFWPLFLFSQGQDKLKTEAFAIISAHGNYFMPMGDFNTRFGVFTGIGPEVMYKLSSNWLIGGEYTFYFGNKVKNTEEILKNLKTSTGDITDANGIYGNLSITMQGHVIGGKFGKIIPLMGTNQNSGLLLLGGVGFMQYNIRYDNSEKSIPQLQGDYERGYDRLSNGLAFNQFVGYIHFSDKNVLNFYAGFEFQEAFTKSDRDYQFDLMAPDLKKNTDLMLGFRVAWMFPIKRNSPGEYYY